MTNLLVIRKHCKTLEIIHEALPVNKSRKKKHIKKLVRNNQEILNGTEIA